MRIITFDVKLSHFYSVALIALWSCSNGSGENNTSEKKELTDFEKFRSYFYFLDADTIHLYGDSEYYIENAIIQIPDSIRNIPDLGERIKAELHYREDWKMEHGKMSYKIPDDWHPAPDPLTVDYSLCEIDMPDDLQGFLVFNTFADIRLMIFKNEEFVDILNLTTNNIEQRDSLMFFETNESWIAKTDSTFEVWTMGQQFLYDPWRDEVVFSKDTSNFRTLKNGLLISQPQNAYPDSLERNIARCNSENHKDLKPYRELHQTTDPFDIFSDTLHIYEGLTLWDDDVPFERMFFDFDYLEYLSMSHPGFFVPERYLIELDFYGLYRMKMWDAETSYDNRIVGILVLTEGERIDLTLINGVQAWSRIPMAWTQYYDTGQTITESWIYWDHEVREAVVMQRWLEMDGPEDEWESGLRKFVVGDYGYELEEKTAPYGAEARFRFHAYPKFGVE
jgi:hypothetical protein